MPRIFLSYRRADGVASGARSAIYQALEGHYGARSVFMDVERMQVARDFRDSLREELRSTDVVIALIGPAWTELMRQRGPAEADFVRIEIEMALEYDKPVLPLLLGEQSAMPSSEDLPESIRAMAFNHGVQLDTGRFFNESMARLLADLDEHVFPADSTRRRRRRLTGLVLAAGVGVGIVAGAGYWLATRGTPAPGNGAVETIAENSTRIADSLETVAERFAALGRAGGVIEAPQEAYEHYHNARIYELRGDYGNARRAYLALLASDIDKLDPHLRFTDFLRVQEGRAGALETYRTLVNNDDSFLRRYVQALLAQRASRVSALEQLALERTDFAPLYYHLSLDFSAGRLGAQSFAEVRRERELLQSFQAKDASGHLVKHLIDQSLAKDWRADAEKRRAKLEALAETALLEAPVNITWMKSNLGWGGTIQIAEPALGIEWRTAEAAAFKTMAPGRNVDQRTGKPRPQSHIQLTRTQGETQVFVRYQDRRGVWQGPYTAAFKPADESLSGDRQIIEMTRNGWVAFRDYDGKVLLYFSHLMSYRGSIARIDYGLDAEAPDTRFEFPAFDGTGTASISPDVPVYLEVPAETTYVSVQVTYKDGKASEIVRFER